MSDLGELSKFIPDKAWTVGGVTLGIGLALYLMLADPLGGGCVWGKDTTVATTTLSTALPPVVADVPLHNTVSVRKDTPTVRPVYSSSLTDSARIIDSLQRVIDYLELDKITLNQIVGELTFIREGEQRFTTTDSIKGVTVSGLMKFQINPYCANVHVEMTIDSVSVPVTTTTYREILYKDRADPLLIGIAAAVGIAVGIGLTIAVK